MREYDESVQVRLRSNQPMAFRWRSRSYHVRHVLEQWCERTNWWAQSADGARELERTVWLLEAKGDGAAAPGVFELASGQTGWSLLRVTD